MSVSSSKNQRYDLEFRNKAVQLALTSAKPIAAIAADLGIKASTIYHWVKVHKKGFVSSNSTHGPRIYEENALLRKEVARLREERDILKKAATYFARESR